MPIPTAWIVERKESEFIMSGGSLTQMDLLTIPLVWQIFPEFLILMVHCVYANSALTLGGNSLMDGKFGADEIQT